jgi:uncharacterized protein (UPF0276 family)
MPGPRPVGIGTCADLGFGIGVRAAFLDELLDDSSGFEFFEVITEQFLDAGAEASRVLGRLAARAPIVLHGLSLSIAGTDPLDLVYVRRLRRLADRFEARWVSDHLSWSGVDGVQTYELLPFPHTEATFAHVAARVAAVQEVLGRPLVLENPTGYLGFDESSMPEPEFLGRLADRTGCRLLLDVNNVHVSAVNLGFDPVHYVDALPVGAVVQIHVAGHRVAGGHLLDSHDDRVAPAVWDLYGHACRRFGRVSTSLEWDTRLPALDVLRGELRKAAEVRASATAAEPTRPVAAEGVGRTATGTTAAALADCQRMLQEAILGGETSGYGAATARGLSIHGNGYRATRVRAVSASYPVLGELFGSQLAALVVGHLTEWPDLSGDLAGFARDFAETLVGVFRGQDVGGLVGDVVAFETACLDLGKDRLRVIQVGNPAYLRALSERAGVRVSWEGESTGDLALVGTSAGVRAIHLRPGEGPSAPGGGGL